MAVKPLAHVRIHSLPYSLDPDPSLLNPAICNLGSFHLGKLATIRATVVKAGPVKIFEHSKYYVCNKCKHK
jgi:DNA replicative helicase MCM subunit Mcm2 (Cdc46/Mcm family)